MIMIQFQHYITYIEKFYLIIFFVIMGVGLALTPFVPMLAKDNTGNINIHITYIIFLISVTITYLFAHKTSLINAYKDNYITTLITSITTIFEGILQILVIKVTKSFIYFLLIRIISSTLNGLITNYIYNKKYKNISMVTNLLRKMLKVKSTNMLKV